LKATDFSKEVCGFSFGRRYRKSAGGGFSCIFQKQRDESFSNFSGKYSVTDKNPLFMDKTAEPSNLYYPVNVIKQTEHRRQCGNAYLV
jgi:hypothetical protein